MDVSDHAIKRIRERLGLKKAAAIREAERAADGMQIGDFGGRFRRHLDNLRHLHGEKSHYRVTPNGIFAYQGGVMTTVLPLPVEHRKSVMTQWKKHQERTAIDNAACRG